MCNFDNRFLFVVVVVIIITVVVLIFSFFFFSVSVSDTVIKYDKNKNEENKNEIDIIYYNRRFFAHLMLSMRATFEKWSIDDVRVFIELASLKMQSIFNKQTRMRVRFDSFKIANAIILLYRHFNDNIVVFLWENFSTRIARIT